MYLTIDSTEYAISFRTINRTARPKYKYELVTENGTRHSELVGIYYDYDVEMRISDESYATYRSLWQKITDGTEPYSIIVPDESVSGFNTFNCHFENISDVVDIARDDGTRRFRNLRFSIIAESPSVTP